MRSFIVMAMFVACFAHAAWTDYEEVQNLILDGADIKQLSIKAGAGSMDIKGIAGADDIEVKATIIVPNTDKDDAQEVIAKRMTLSLEKDGSNGELRAWFDDGFLSFNSNAHIVLEVSVPEGMSLDIDDGSGSMDVYDVAGDVSINDGSGSIDIRNVANLRIDDGSGSIDVTGAAGNVDIEDGSGSITVNGVQGSVTIDDGSGSIRVSDVEQDLIIVDDGSGGLSYSDVRGTVDAET